MRVGFGGVKALILHFFPDAGGRLEGKGASIILGLLSGIEQRFPRVASWLLGPITRIPDCCRPRRTGCWPSAGRSSSAYSTGSPRKWPASRWVRGNIVNPVINWVKDFFGIHSPSTVFHGIGFNLIAGLFRGMMSHDIGGFVSKIFGSMPKALDSIVGKGLVAITSLPGKALSALGGLGGDILSLLGLGGGGTFSRSSVTLGKAMAAAMGWTGAQWTALNQLWTRESGWNKSARNPSSCAYGIPQALPASKMASAGADWLTNAATQIRWGPRLHIPRGRGHRSR
jgi:hypothetical protein